MVIKSQNRPKWSKTAKMSKMVNKGKNYQNGQKQQK